MIVLERLRLDIAAQRHHFALAFGALLIDCVQRVFDSSLIGGGHSGGRRIPAGPDLDQRDWPRKAA